jgi:hypothetical protein
MSYEGYGWVLTILLFTVIALIVRITWFLAFESGYDKGFQRGHSMGMMQVNKRQSQLKADNEYLMGRVVNLFDRKNK